MKTHSILTCRNGLFITLMLLALLGCVSQQPEVADTDIARQPDLNMLPPLPLDDGTARESSETTVATLDGSDSWMASGGAAPDGANMNISSSAGMLEYAIYRYETGLTETGQFETTAMLSLPPGSEAWIALSDYTLGRWALYGPYTDDATLPLDTSHYLSSSGNFYITVFVHDGNLVTVGGTSFTFDNGVVPPDSGYLDDVAPIMSANCISCHNSDSPLAGIALDSYRGTRDNAADVIAKSVTGNHNNSGMSQADRDALQAWVDEGTPYGAAVTYMADVMPIVQARCTPCHTGGSSGGVNLGTYANASSNAANALAQILSENMPASGGPLSGEQKDLWQVWVDDGTPE